MLMLLSAWSSFVAESAGLETTKCSYRRFAGRSFESHLSILAAADEMGTGPTSSTHFTVGHILASTETSSHAE
jgi:hypothetical protein